MLTWLTENLGTIVVTCAMIVLVIKIILYLRKERKKGCSSCGGNCSHCALSQYHCAQRQKKNDLYTSYHHHNHISS